MGILSKIFSRKAPVEQRAITYEQLERLSLIKSTTRSGVIVNETTALGISALWCGIRTISQDIGSLCPELYRQDSDGIRYEEEEHAVAKLLDYPNPEMTRIVLFETLTAHALLYGNAYAEIERRNNNTPLYLHPIHPRNVTMRVNELGKTVYNVKVAGMPDVELSQKDMFHVPGLSLNGSGVGEQILTIARETLGFGIATQRYGSAFFGNGCRPGGTLTTAGQLTENARENLRRSLQAMHGGVDNVGKTLILEEGLAYSPFTLTNEQSQYKDVLSWYVAEVARMLVIPPHLLMDLSDSKWANISEQNRDYLTRTLRPWLLKFSAELDRKLLSPGERKSLYIEFDTTTLLQADTDARYAAYKVAIDAGFLTVDEVRKSENLPPLPKPEPVAPTPQPPVVETPPGTTTEPAPAISEGE